MSTNLPESISRINHLFDPELLIKNLKNHDLNIDSINLNEEINKLCEYRTRKSSHCDSSHDNYKQRKLSKERLEYLHNSGLINKKINEMLFKKKMELNKIEEMKDATFHPILNNNGINSTKNIHERFHEYSRRVNKKKNYSKVLKAIKERAPCTFTPKINSK